MKFNKDTYWKHSNCLDAFFKVIDVIQDHNGKAILLGYWMIQGTANFWYGSDKDRIFIRSDQYDKWLSYKPLGNMFV